MTTSSTTSCLRFFGNFAESFSSLVSESIFNGIFARHRPRPGGTPKIRPHQFVMAQVYHAMAGFGTFSAHCRQLQGFKISDNALSLRKHSFSQGLLADLLPAVLAPVAVPELHPEAFHAGLRLAALDGTKLNLRNTAAILDDAPKRPCSKGGGTPAFAHLLSVVLLELGTHAPLATALGWQNEGELTLAGRLLESLPEQSLLLGDRLYGCPSFFWRLRPHLERTGGHALLRIKSNLKARPLRALSDGSWMVGVTVVDPKTRAKTGCLILREIHAEIMVEGSAAPFAMRLWTTLTDEQAHPAKTLVELYARRWEHELFYRELKSHIQGSAQLLHSQTTDAAAQEMFALMLAASLLARQRVAVADSAQTPVPRISLAMVLSQTMVLHRVLAHAEGIITEEQKEQIVRSMLEELEQTAVIPKRGPRQCRRALRQPVVHWPKMSHPTSRPRVVGVEIIQKPA